jgi:RNA polymerase sigma factor (sigma-70 family)
LIIFLLEYINKANFDKFRNRSDGEIVNYIKLLFKNKSIDILRKLLNERIETMRIERELVYDDYYKNIEEEYIFSLMKTLSDAQKKIIIGRYIYGYSDEKLAKSFKVSRQAV